MERKKPYRYPAAKPPVGEAQQEGPCVRFMAPNGENYEVNVLKMQQRNLRTGKTRKVRCRGGVWFFDKHCTKPVPRWLPFSRPVQRSLQDAWKASGQEPIEAYDEIDLPEALLCDATDTTDAVMSHSDSLDLMPAVSEENIVSNPSFTDVRDAALSGAIEQVRWLLCREQIQVLGQEIFDRRYPGFVLGKEHKCCIKMLLARGAKLGRNAPNSKLLRKVESDCLDLWLRCFLRSAALAGMDLPDPVQSYLLEF